MFIHYISEEQSKNITDINVKIGENTSKIQEGDAKLDTLVITTGKSNLYF